MGRIPSWGKVILFLSSYSPLYAIVALRAHNAEYSVLGYSAPTFRVLGLTLSSISIAAILSIGISVGFLWFMLQSRRTRQGQQSSIEKCHNRSDMFTEYLLVYVFPFIVFDFADLYDLVAFLILFMTVAAIVVRSNRLYINPVLVAFRYHVYEIETPHDRRLLLTKEPIDGNSTINTARISNGVYISTN